MSHRLRLHHRRSLETIAIEHEGQRFKVGIGRELACVDRGQLGPVVEVFLNGQKVNSSIDVIASDGAILMSMLIQFGCPPDLIEKSMKRNNDGSPASPLGVAAVLISESVKQGG